MPWQIAQRRDHTTAATTSSACEIRKRAIRLRGARAPRHARRRGRDAIGIGLLDSSSARATRATKWLSQAAARASARDESVSCARTAPGGDRRLQRRVRVRGGEQRRLRADRRRRCTGVDYDASRSISATRRPPATTPAASRSRTLIDAAARCDQAGERAARQDAADRQPSSSRTDAGDDRDPRPVERACATNLGHERAATATSTTRAIINQAMPTGELLAGGHRPL